MQFKFLLAILAAVMAVCALAPVQAEDTEFFFKECEGAPVCFKCCQEKGHTVSVTLSSGHEATCVCELVKPSPESH